MLNRGELSCLVLTVIPGIPKTLLLKLSCENSLENVSVFH